MDLVRICAILLYMSAAAGNETDSRWALANETKDGIVIYSRILDGSEIREYKATIPVNAVPARVWRVVMDKETYRHLPSYVAVNTICKTADNAVWYNYQVVAPPLMTRRDYVLRYKSFENLRAMRYRIIWTAGGECGPPPSREMIRVNVCNGSLAVEPVEGGTKSVITYHLSFDPGGSVPAWVVNIANRSSIPGFLRTLRDHSCEEKDGSK